MTSIETVAHSDELLAARATIETLRSRIGETQDRLHAAHLEMNDFRIQVRDRIIQAHKNGDICLDGMNGGLSDLGLDAYVQAWCGTVTIQVDVTVSGTDNEDTARTWAQDALSVRTSDGDVVINDFDKSADEFCADDE